MIREEDKAIRSLSNVPRSDLVAFAAFVVMKQR